MLDPVTLEIKARFYEAFDRLVELGFISTKEGFYERHGIDKRNFHKIRNSDSLRIDLRLVALLASKYNVSADWLLTGRGKMFESL